MESSSNPFRKEYIIDQIRGAVAHRLTYSLNIPFAKTYQGVDIGKTAGDFNVAVPRFRLDGNAEEWAIKVANTFKPDEYVEQVVRSGAFLVYYARTTSLLKLVLGEVRQLSPPAGNPTSTYGQNASGRGKTVLIEFSSPNIAKPFHAGHLRSTIIGAFLSNIFAANGWEVVRFNYLGDWGKQFGLLAVGFKRYGSEEALSENPIMHLFNVYVAVNGDIAREKEGGQQQTTNEEAKEFFRKLENGDSDALALWQRFRDLSIAGYTETYKRLNVHFDVYGGESLVKPKSMDAVLHRLREKGLLTTKTKKESSTDWKAAGKRLNVSEVPDEDTEEDDDDDSAIAIDLQAYKLGKPVLQKSDGTTIYMVRDVAGAIERHEKYHFDKMLYVVGEPQSHHMAQFFKILELLGEPFTDKLEHVKFGSVLGMSTRKGNVKFLDEILDNAKQTMFEQMKKNADKFNQVEDPEETSDQIGMTAVKIQDQQAKKIISYMYDEARMTSFEGDTGPYLQYAHARLCSMERKVAPELVLRSSTSEIDTDLLTEAKARELVFLLATYPDVVRTALKTYEPSTVVTYCFRLAHLISSVWETMPVKGQEKELAQARLLMYTCARHVLASAMRLLSIVPLERM